MHAQCRRVLEASSHSRRQEVSIEIPFNWGETNKRAAVTVLLIDSTIHGVKCDIEQCWFPLSESVCHNMLINRLIKRRITKGNAATLKLLHTCRLIYMMRVINLILTRRVMLQRPTASDRAIHSSMCLIQDPVVWSARACQWDA